MWLVGCASRYDDDNHRQKRTPLRFRNVVATPTQAPAVKRECAFEIGNFQMHMADACRRINWLAHDVSLLFKFQQRIPKVSQARDRGIAGCPLDADSLDTPLM